jgi:very-short-patch-repair endonuclease
MGKVFTKDIIKNSKCAHLNKHLFDESEDAEKERRSEEARKSSKGKSKYLDKMHWELFGWCKLKGYELLTEYRFHEYRKYRFDFAIKELMVGIEYEGGIFKDVSGHKNVRNYQKDVEKYNLAQSLGWKIIRFTALNYKIVIQTLEKNI